MDTHHAAAVIVGINNYKNDSSLSSAVNDAQAIKQVLIDLKLVEEADITLITAPEGGAEGMATKQIIANALREFYRNPERYNRLYFFFAGHGISAYADSAQVVLRPVILAQDVVSLVDDGAAMIDLNELRDYLRSFGPKEQFFFIDACRDLNYDEYPNVGNLGWGKKRDTTADNNCQATLFAVAPLGQAQAAIDGLGVMTGHVLEALRSDRLAVQYDDGLGAWTVSMSSLAEYVKAKVEETVKDQPFWTKMYNLPELDAPDPKPAPLRVLGQIGATPLTVNIQPEEAAQQTQVKVISRGDVLENNSLPPRKNHEELPLHPQRYAIEVTSQFGKPDPEKCTVDVRWQAELSISISQPVKGLFAEEELPEPSLAAFPFVQVKGGNPASAFGQIHASAGEPEVTVELESLEGSHQFYTQPKELKETVSPGPYQVRFRLGKQVFNQGEIYLMRGQEIEVHPTVSGSALLNEVLDLKGQAPEGVVVSESIGLIQAGVLDTILPIIGIKPFDITHQFFHQFEGLVAPAPAGPPDQPWLSVVVAVDGNRWPQTVEQVLGAIKCRVVERPAGNSSQLLELRKLNRSGLQSDRGSADEGFNRVRLGIMPLTSDSFWLAFNSPLIGEYEIASATIKGRATVITITLHPDGTVDLSQALLRYPGRDWLYSSEMDPHVSPGRAMRTIQMGQKLYQSGELFLDLSLDLLQEVAYAKWTDPVLSCMGFYALQQKLRASQPPFLGFTSDMQRIAQNLNGYFGNLPDSRVIYGQVFENEQTQIYLDLLNKAQVPILAESARRLARFAEENGYPTAEVVKAVRRIPAGEIWTLMLKG